MNFVEFAVTQNELEIWSWKCIEYYYRDYFIARDVKGKISWLIDSLEKNVYDGWLTSSLFAFSLILHMSHKLVQAFFRFLIDNFYICTISFNSEIDPQNRIQYNTVEKLNEWFDKKVNLNNFQWSRSLFYFLDLSLHTKF